MRDALPLLLASTLGFAGCGGAPPPSDARPPSAAASSSARNAPNDVGDRAARACIAAASDAPFERFTAPIAGSSFRAHLAERVAELDCCFTPARREELRGARLRVHFTPRTEDPADGAAGTLIAPVEAAYPNEASCLARIVSRWVMSPAPVSDVVRVPLDPRISHRADAASLTIVYPL